MLQKLFLNLSWPILVWMVLLFCFELKESKFVLIKKNKFVLLSSAAILLVVYVGVEHGYRTLSDETNLLSSSLSMFDRKTVENGLVSESYYGILQTTTSLIPKRPLLFSFLESVLHTLFGFHNLAGMYLNLAALFFTLLVFGFLGFVYFGPMGCLGLQLVLLSHPLMSLYATCAGFDLFSSVGVLAFLIFAKAHMTYQRRSSLRLLLIASVVLCHCRYESFAFSGAVLAILWRMNYLSIKEVFKEKKLLFTLLLFTLPIVAQRILSIGGYEQPQGKSLFSQENFMRNAAAFIKNFWNYELYLPYNFILNCLLVIGIMPALIIVLRKPKSVGRDISIISFILVFIDLAIIMPHVGGQLNDATQFRYFIIMCLFSVYLYFLVSLHFKFSGKSHLVFGIICFLIFHPIAQEDKVHARLILNREFKVEKEFIQKSHLSNILIITERPGMWTAERQPAISFEIALIKGKQQQLERATRENLYNKILVFQHVFYNLEDETKLGYVPYDNDLKGWNLNPLYKRQLSFDHYLLVSEVLPLEKAVEPSP